MSQLVNSSLRDARGNVMAMYELSFEEDNSPESDDYIGELELLEHPIYGSSRIGLKNHKGILAGEAAFTATITGGEFESITHDQSFSFNMPLGPGSRTLGDKRYEMTNHLGNVLATINDRKVPDGTGTTVNFYEPDVLTISDYYPFGMVMPGRQHNDGNYRYGFNGMEKDDEVSGTGNWQDYGMRMYNPRLGRFPNVDPISNKFPMLSPYQFASLNPVMNIDLDGLEGTSFMSVLAKAMGMTTATEKANEQDIKGFINKTFRLSGDALIVGGGAISIAASGGTATPIALGVIGVVGGSAKFYFDAKGDYNQADDIPTTISGSVMVTANYTVGDDVFSKDFIATAEFVEGVVTLDLKNFSNKGSLEQLNEGVSTLNLIIDGSSLPENLQNLLAPSNPFPKPDQKFGERDNTNVSTPAPFDKRVGFDTGSNSGASKEDKN